MESPNAAGAGQAPRDHDAADHSLADRMTIIITTSAVRSNPRTDLLRTVVGSFSRARGLAGCRIIIVADGPKLKPSGLYRPKQGFVDDDGLVRYDQFKENVSRLCGHPEEPYFRRAELLALDRRMGFGFAVKAGLERATTELVMVVQHDRMFLRQVDLQHAVRCFDNHPEVNYFMLPTKTTARYRRTCRIRMGLDTAPYVIRQPCGPGCRSGGSTDAAATDSPCSPPSGGATRGGAEGSTDPSDLSDHRLVPLLFWFDSTHVARRDAYLRIVYENWEEPQGKHHVRRGDFIEVRLERKTRLSFAPCALKPPRPSAVPVCR